MSYLISTLSEETIDSLMPSTDDWSDALRFYCQTSSPRDPGLEFMASMWSYAIYNGCLTGKQADSAIKYLCARGDELPQSIKPRFFARIMKADM